MYFPTLNVNAYNFKSISCFFINSDGMHFFTMYYNLNYNVCVRSIGHDGKEW